MGLNIEIPKELSHLKIDERGYPIPFFVGMYQGKYEFRYINPIKWDLIIDKHLCHICGKKLSKDYHYFISGPIGYKNRVSSDGAMHRICAEFSLRACPHLFFKNADRRENDELAKQLIEKQIGSPIIKEKPSLLLLIKSSKFKPFAYNGNRLIRYTPVSFETFEYIDGKLSKVDPNPG